MKTIKLLSAGLMLTGLMACAQKNDVPKVVTDAFAKKFTSATSVKWDKESDTEWEAEFKMDGTAYSANFESNGTWKETEHEIEISKVSQIVQDALMKAYPDYKLKESEISETSAGMFYEFEIKNGKTELEILIDSNGTITNKKVSEDDKNDNDDED